VTSNALRIARAEGAREDVCATAALLHELFTFPKSHPDSSRAGDVCAEHARALLLEERAPVDLCERVCAAIRDHAFSKGVVPDALESRVLQDANRLDALGAVGLARMWAMCACKAMLDNLVARGLAPNRSRLFVIDGSKGLRAALRSHFG
jgi:uncharacterized protein